MNLIASTVSTAYPYIGEPTIGMEPLWAQVLFGVLLGAMALILVGIIVAVVWALTSDRF